MSTLFRPSADGSSLDVATPRALFQGRTPEAGAYPTNFKLDDDVSADGEHF